MKSSYFDLLEEQNNCLSCQGSGRDYESGWECDYCEGSGKSTNKDELEGGDLDGMIEVAQDALSETEHDK